MSRLRFILEFGIVYCTCGKCTQPTEKSRQHNKDRYDSLSIPGYEIKKNQSRGPRHVQSMRQTIYHKGRDMLRKDNLSKNGSCETIRERWYTDADYRTSLSDEGSTEEKIRQCDAIAMEDHSHEATPEERRRWQRNWKIVFNKGVQGPTRQRPDFVKRSTLIVDCTKNMLSVPDKEISQSIQHNKEGKILNNNLMNTRSTPKRFTLELDGNIILQQVRPHLRSGSRTVNGSRHKVGSVGDLQPGLNSKKF